MNTSLDPGPNTFLCGTYGPNVGTECLGFLLESMQASLWVLYNASSSTLNYTNPCGTGTVAVPPDYTYIYALLDFVARIDGGTNQCTGCACFSLSQSGRIACPFSDLGLPLASTSGACFCDPSSATVIAGIA